MNDLIPYVHVYVPEHYKKVESDAIIECCGVVSKYVHTGPGLDVEDLEEAIYQCEECATVWIPAQPMWSAHVRFE